MKTSTIITLAVCVFLFLFVFSACAQQPVQEKTMPTTASVQPQVEFEGIPQPPEPLGVVDETSEMP